MKIWKLDLRFVYGMVKPDALLRAETESPNAENEVCLFAAEAKIRIV